MERWRQEEPFEKEEPKENFFEKKKKKKKYNGAGYKAEMDVWKGKRR